MSTTSRLRDLIENGDSLPTSAERTLAAFPQLGVDEGDLDQLLRAFSSLMLEALSGGDEVRALFLDTAIPAYVEQGAGAGTMIAANTYFAVDVTDRLLAAMREDARDEAREWLADFWSAYIRDVADRAFAAEAPR